ncbi:KxYKxGKxW signal peptide domain-containing protein, partial [Lentilactobacillus hilgardii]
MELKRHYKMYKAGKKWVFAAIATISIIAGLNTVAVTTYAAGNNDPQQTTTQNAPNNSNDPQSTTTQNTANNSNDPQSTTTQNTANNSNGPQSTTTQ